jgi:hypothetical protein
MYCVVKLDNLITNKLAQRVNILVECLNASNSKLYTIVFMTNSNINKYFKLHLTFMKSKCFANYHKNCHYSNNYHGLF